MYQGYSRGVIPYEKECLTSPEILKQKAIMNEFRMSLFLAPISPVKDDETGKVVKPEVYKIINTNEQLKQLTGQVRMAVESGDTQACRRLKQENLPYVTPCGVFTRRRSDCLTETSGLVVVDVDHLQSLAEAEALRQRLFDDPYLCPTLVFVSPTGRGVKAFVPCLHEQNPAEGIQWAMNYVHCMYDAENTQPGQGVDTSGKDVVRACFLCHDEGALMKL